MISRGNRNFENYYINGRYVKSSIISKAIEDAYKDFTMQHKYPFVVLHMDIDGESVDVNVHPTKMELRFNRQQEVYNTVYAAVDQGLHEKELIPHVEIDVPTSKITPQTTDSLSQKNISQKAVEPQKESIPQNAVTPAKAKPQ